MNDEPSWTIEVPHVEWCRSQGEGYEAYQARDVVVYPAPPLDTVCVKMPGCRYSGYQSKAMEALAGVLGVELTQPRYLERRVSPEQVSWVGTVPVFVSDGRHMEMVDEAAFKRWQDSVSVDCAACGKSFKDRKDYWQAEHDWRRVASFAWLRRSVKKARLDPLYHSRKWVCGACADALIDQLDSATNEDESAWEKIRVTQSRLRGARSSIATRRS